MASSRSGRSGRALSTCRLQFPENIRASLVERRYGSKDEVCTGQRGPVSLAPYDPSQQNTFTATPTDQMHDDV